MEKHQTVKKRIFWSNTFMVFVTLSMFLAINFVFLKLYFRSVEQEMILSAGQTLSTHGLEDLIEDWTIHNNDFLLLFFFDGAICILVLMIVSQFFTRNLTAHMMRPLHALTMATQRMKDNDLTCPIEYVGDREFEEICQTFNEMQSHLRNAQERNKKYEKARTDMIAGISHDLRTPLTAIKGAVKGILDGVIAQPEQQKAFLQIAYRRTEDMDRLLNQLFYLSKVETGSLTKQFDSVPITEFLQTYKTMTQAILDNETETLEVEIHGTPTDVLVQREQLQRILDNLVENSRKYAKRTPLRMKITLDEGKDWLDLCFSDNGVGVPKKDLPYLFDEFYRVDESRSHKDGNGLGLYIVKCLMETMGGCVTAENAGGLKFHFMLPMTQKGKTADE